MDLHFKTNIQLKSIIGKDLINDDNIAILELVKNSFDADAKRVGISFVNLKENDDAETETYTDKTSRLIIADDGQGMDMDDIQNKWLNIAYSEKKSNSRQNNRMMAGAKGVGRFSCDRLGEYLNLYAKKINSDTYFLLKIDWKKFEIEDDKKEIQSIVLDYEEFSADELKARNIPFFDHGVILEIIKLRSNWAYKGKNIREHSNKWDVDKFINLKKYLERLINPNQAYEKNDFGIYLDAKEFVDENKNLKGHEKFIGKIESSIFEKLDFKTTSIESEIIDNGKAILTTLKDKGKTIFWIKEKNEFYPDIKNAKCFLYYLNTYSKAFFTKQTGVRPIEYGSIYLFLNGFRVPPFGEEGDDWLNLEQRKNQGYARFLGSRDIVGRIEILDTESNFNIISSREGLVKNESFSKLTNRNNSYFYRSFKRLERYVVDGLNWDSAAEEVNLFEFEKKIILGQLKENELKFREEDVVKRRRVYSSIHSIIGAKAIDVIELYINEDLILDKIKEEKINSEREFEQLILDFENKKIDGDTLNRILQRKAFENKELEKQLQDFSKYSTSDATTKAIAEIQQYKLINERHVRLIEELKVKLERIIEESYKNRIKLEKLESEKLEAEERARKEKNKREEAETRETEERSLRKKTEKEKEKTEKELEQKTKQSIFQQAILGTEKEQIIALQHQIGHSSSRIRRNISLLLQYIDKSLLDAKMTKYISTISLEAAKIESISNYVTKANFDLHAGEIEKDLVQFIAEYINEIYLPDELNNEPIIKTSLLLIDVVNENNCVYITTFRPLEITTLVDNFIQNAAKADAQKISFKFNQSSDRHLIIDIMNDGKSISNENFDKIFELGFTTTNGSGIGLFNVKGVVQRLNGTIKVISENQKGVTFKIII